MSAGYYILRISESGACVLVDGQAPDMTLTSCFHASPYADDASNRTSEGEAKSGQSQTDDEDDDEENEVIDKNESHDFHQKVFKA
jgi:hypothetical protein